MFRRLAASINTDPSLSGPIVFDLHPMQLARYLEEAWINREPNATVLPTPDRLEVPSSLRTQEATSFIVPALPPNVVWDHLIYAYMVENTRAYEIFRRVLEEFLYGERLGTPSNETHHWLRTTEQLFYSADAPLRTYALTSWVRPDPRAIRRNAYFRMFGMDLNHGTDDNRPYPYPRAAAANSEFVPTWEDFLREVWRGIENFGNSSGAKPTDDATIARLARTLNDMLRLRRLNGNLSRDELLHVSTQSWLHLTISLDSPIIVDLEAQGNAPEERLLKVGERVGLPAHSRSGSYLRLADTMSFILRAVEVRQFNDVAGAQTLYDKTALPPDIFNAMNAIIRDWSIATGRDMKAHRVSVTTPPSTPIRPPARPIVPASSNGRAQMTHETLPVG
jgi:hypothetical protein